MFQPIVPLIVGRAAGRLYMMHAKVRPHGQIKEETEEWLDLQAESFMIVAARPKCKTPHHCRK
jgi:hypothetical protein